jgi:hypothetical protein
MITIGSSFHNGLKNLPISLFKTFKNFQDKGKESIFFGFVFSPILKLSIIYDGSH